MVQRSPADGSAPTPGPCRATRISSRKGRGTPSAGRVERSSRIGLKMAAQEKFFSSKTGRGVRIAVVDSGIHAAHPHVGGIAGGVAFAPGGRATDDFIDRLGHGTAVAAAIREKAPGAEIFAVKVFHDALATGVSQLVRAIDWAAERRIHLVNLSLGTANPAHEAALRSAVERAARAGTLLVSAREHQGARWFPGSLPGVLPVLLDW